MMIEQEQNEEHTKEESRTSCSVFVVTRFFKAGKLGVSIVLRSPDQKKIDACSHEIFDFVKQKSIQIIKNQ